MKTEAKFYLEKRKNKDTGEIIDLNVPILLFYSIGGSRLQYFTGYRVDAARWDEKNMRVIKGGSDASDINQELAKLKTKVEDEVAKAKILNTEITIEDLRQVLKGKPVISQSRDKKGFFAFFNEYLESSKIIKTKGTMRAITCSYNYFLDFEKDTGFKMEFKKIDQNFYDKFLEYCFAERNVKNAYTGKLIKDLKAFLNWASDRGYNTHYDFRKKSFKRLTEDVEILFLTYEELMQLYNFNLGTNVRLEQVRDVFCFGCFTGMRFSDICSLEKENIHKNMIRYRVIKTNQNNTIPLNPFTQEIINKYAHKKLLKLLPVISEPKTNEYLKELFTLVKIKRKVQITHFQGAKRIQQTLPLNEVVTFHMSKKTFMTNFLAKGGSLLTAMSITGNKDFKTAKRYYKVVDELKTDEMTKVFGAALTPDQLAKPKKIRKSA